MVIGYAIANALLVVMVLTALTALVVATYKGLSREASGYGRRGPARDAGRRVPTILDGNPAARPARRPGRRPDIAAGA
ncbi:MAG: hypothetical protein ACREPA_01620 [Candidatus Dormibacteraceae bacterium]